MKNLTTNWIGAIIGAGAAFYIGKRFVGGGTIVNIASVAIGALAGATIQSKIKAGKK